MQRLQTGITEIELYTVYDRFTSRTGICCASIRMMTSHICVTWKGQKGGTRQEMRNRTQFCVSNGRGGGIVYTGHCLDT